MIKKRILHVYPQLNCGGTEMVIYNLIKFGNHDKYQYEILVQQKGCNDETFNNIGVKIHIVPYISLSEYRRGLYDFFRNEKFDIIHTHTHREIPVVLSVAKTVGINKRIVHSHSARTDLSKFFWTFRFLNNHRFEKNATILLGCSKAALKWLFPLNWSKGIVLNNGVDIKKFQFNPIIRNKIRDKLNIPSTAKVHIYVGRFTEGKNQSFIINLAEQNHRRDEYFILIGDGPELKKTQDYINERVLTNVLCVGLQNNVNEWLSAADNFLFPSKFEGLGIVAVEAQVNGLRVIATDAVPQEADLHMGNFFQIPLTDKERWNKLMDKEPYSYSARSSLSFQSFATDYNISLVTKELELIYDNK